MSPLNAFYSATPGPITILQYPIRSNSNANSIITLDLTFKLLDPVNYNGYFLFKLDANYFSILPDYKLYYY